jgi:taurine transport system substrate-binding protein
MNRFFRPLAAFVTLLAVSAPFASVAHADTKEVVIAYQDMVVPWRYAQATGEVEKETGYKVVYRQLGSGAEVVRALASGSVQLGEAGSSPIAAGLSQGVDISLFWILDNINDAEALVARDGSGVTSLAGLKGKKIGVPFVSTSHFHTLVALQAAGVNPNDVKIVNLRPQEVAAAWDRGDIDATYIWDPVLAKVKKNGKVLITSGQVAQETGKATFDGFVVDRKFAQQNPEFVARFVKVLAASDANYRDHTSTWNATSGEVRSECPGCAGEPRTLRIPVAGSAGVEHLAGRRCAIWSGEIARCNGGVPEDPRDDPERVARLLGGHRSTLCPAGGTLG